MKNLQSSQINNAALTVVSSGYATIRRRKSGFTLVEVLVVITIIGVLAAVLFPLARNMKERASQSVCSGNLRQIGVAVMSFAGDNGMKLPPNNLNKEPSGYSPLFEVLRPYTGGGNTLERMEVWECPGQSIVRKSPSGLSFGYSGNPKLLVDSRDSDHGGSVAPGDLGSWISVASVARPEAVFLLIDAGQRTPSGWPTEVLTNISATTTGAASNANVAMTGKPFILPDTDLGGGGARYRHGAVGKEGADNVAGQANILFLDGHVEGVRKGGVLQKNVYYNY